MSSGESPDNDGEVTGEFSPSLLFDKCGGRGVRFRGLLAPGTDRTNGEEDLVAVWRTTNGQRFQNYRARFTGFDTGSVTRNRIKQACLRRPVNPPPSNLTGYRLRGEVAVGLSGGCEIPAQPLCARLADMHCSADGPYRGNAVRCQVIREHDCGSLPSNARPSKSTGRGC
jgi:hypothetical protein